MGRPKRVLTPEDLEVKRLKTAEYSRNFYATHEAHRIAVNARSNARFAILSPLLKAATVERKRIAHEGAMAAAVLAAELARLAAPLVETPRWDPLTTYGKRKLREEAKRAKAAEAGLAGREVVVSDTPKILVSD